MECLACLVLYGGVVWCGVVFCFGLDVCVCVCMFVVAAESRVAHVSLGHSVLWYSEIDVVRVDVSLSVAVIHSRITQH